MSDDFKAWVFIVCVVSTVIAFTGSGIASYQEQYNDRWRSYYCTSDQQRDARRAVAICFDNGGVSLTQCRRQAVEKLCSAPIN